jgi:hypothetical protein
MLVIASACIEAGEQTEGDSNTSETGDTEGGEDNPPSMWTEQIAFSTNDGKVGIYEVGSGEITQATGE